MERHELIGMVNWDKVLSVERYAGGHQEVMDCLFYGNAKVLAFHIDDDYQGQLVYCYEFKDDSIAIITDYYGSCSGCDVWDGCDDEEAESNIKAMVSSAKLLNSLDDAILFLEDKKINDAENYSHRKAIDIYPKLRELQAKRIKC